MHNLIIDFDLQLQS